MPLNAESPRPGGGSGDHGMSSFCGDDLQATTTRQSPTQAQNLVRRSGARPPLRLVLGTLPTNATKSGPPPQPPRPRRHLLAVRISAFAGSAPHCRSRPFRLTHDDLDELIAVAMRMEGRRA